MNKAYPFFPFRIVFASDPPKRELIDDAQRRVDAAQSRPPDDRDDAHPATHPYSETWKRLQRKVRGEL